MKVGVIGLGSMGMGAALSLLRAGHEVTGCDMRESARAEFAAAGGAVAASADALPQGTEALVVLVHIGHRGQERSEPRLIADGRGRGGDRLQLHGLQCPVGLAHFRIQIGGQQRR